MMAIEINPEHLGAHEYLGELYLMMGNKIKAKDMLQALKKLAGNKISIDEITIIETQIISQEQYKEKLEKLKKSIMQKMLTGEVRVKT